MYAVFQNGGKQYRVIKGQILCIDKLEVKVGNIILFSDILIISKYPNIYIGNPFVNSSKIIAKIISHYKDKKIIILKFKRRKHFKKRQGHRQFLSCIKIIDIKI